MQFISAVEKAAKNNKKTVAIFLAIIVAALAVTFAPSTLGAKDSIFVDADAKGEMDGSHSKPYNKIQDALDKAKSKGKNVIVKEGTYHENIEIPEDVELIGEDREDVVLQAKTDKEPVVIMNDDTLIVKMTIKNGDRGIEVDDGARATISRCNVIENDKDGIKAKKAKTDKEHALVVEDSYIAHNGWDGIYTEERKVSIKHTDIEKNGKDGIDLEDGSEGTLEDNHMRYNGGVGAKVAVDGSELWFDRNTFYGSGKDGVEIEAKGDDGSIGFEKCKFYRNDDYGIARISKAPFSEAQWASSVTVQNDNIFWDNHDGMVSPVISEIK